MIFTPGFLCKGCRKVRHLDIPADGVCTCGAFIAPTTRVQLAHNILLAAKADATPALHHWCGGTTRGVVRPAYKYPDLMHHGKYNTGRLQKVDQETHQSLFYNTRRTGDQVKYVPDGRTYTIEKSGGHGGGDSTYKLKHSDGTVQHTDSTLELHPVNGLTDDDYKRYGGRYTRPAKLLTAAEAARQLDLV